jgi:predicted ATPase/class 3 adenylate cyclase
MRRPLPIGTVTLLFSDVEGSTRLLMRLGAAYVEVLDGQRSTLRSAWSAHGGAEMATEGDSFFVVFSSAQDAVSAAVQAQRALFAYPWPEGEQVRVRMGVHTGSPMLHNDGYVGRDVHRAARIAAAAHGGQVVLSEETADLVRGTLPKDVRLLDLGGHLLKDIPHPERLFQLEVDGLPSTFPTLKSIGAPSSLPAPPLPLVGRDDELADLAGAVASGVRLLTLTGPGGVGKSRLAVAVAHRLGTHFPDGLYFVPLSMVTTPDMMWTSIAAALDVPAEDRVASTLFRHLANRRALFVLDNLEQLPGADSVVAELLSEGPQVALIATSRRPVHVPAEHEHAVAPLDLPLGDGFDAVRRSGAVQLFVQTAHRVRSSFTLTPANAAEVAAVCRRLDGLPLALELAAARTKVLSPRALLSRLDRALDIAASTSQVPPRQRTLRETIAWSYDLLSPRLQDFFRVMGVFAGGADLDAIAAVASNPDDSDTVDTLDLVADLVDASLLVVVETGGGEPRVRMLQILRMYAREELIRIGKDRAVLERHAHYYLGVAEALSAELYGKSRVQARVRFDAEHDNLRVALDWALPGNMTPAADQERVQTGLRLCIAMNGFWKANGYLGEGRQWLERAVQQADGCDSPELAQCFSLLARKLRLLSEPDPAIEWATRAIDLARRVNDGPALSTALTTLAAIESDRGRVDAARALYEQVVLLDRAAGDKASLYGSLVDFGILESSEHNHSRALELADEALHIAGELGHTVGALTARHNMAWTLREMGQTREAEQQMRRLIPAAVAVEEPAFLLPLAADYAAILAELGEHDAATRLLAAADAMHDRLGSPPDPLQHQVRATTVARTRVALGAARWGAAYRDGRRTTIEQAMAAATDVALRGV